MAQRRTSPRRSGDNKNAGRNTLRSAAAMQIKAKNRNRPNYNGFSFIEVVLVRSKHTSYILCIQFPTLPIIFGLKSGGDKASSFEKSKKLAL
jgi:hypothetical protein